MPIRGNPCPPISGQVAYFWAELTGFADAPYPTDRFDRFDGADTVDGTAAALFSASIGSTVAAGPGGRPGALTEGCGRRGTTGQFIENLAEVLFPIRFGNP